VRVRRFRRQELRIESFELVEVGPGLALVRLAGEWRSEVPSVVRLVAVRGGVERELPPLPEPPGDGGGLWRAAFSAQGNVLGSAFSLHTDDGRSFELPRLVRRAPEREPSPAESRSRARVAERRPEPRRERRPEPRVEPRPESRPERRRFEPAEDGPAVVPPEEALRAERARAERTEASLREQLRIMVSETAEFLGRLEGYEQKRAELEKELSWERLLHKETRRVLAEAEQERDEVAAQVDRAAGTRRQLAHARERIEELERQVSEQDELLGQARASVDRGSKRLAALEKQLLALREARGVASGVPAVSGVPSEMLERARRQADRGTEQLAELERRLTELRELV
jgi:hypothetical protein